MKKYFFLSCFCALAMVLPAQKKMYVWVNDVPTEYAIAEVDSVTFADALPEPEPKPEPFFTVSAEGQKVLFASGNLQYTFPEEENGGEGTWSFAEHQYDFIGTDNVEGGGLATTIDLFGWSGDTGSAEWGINISKDDHDYSGEFRDWGQNIGGDGATWRTLSTDEWVYLCQTRANASSLYGAARINLNGDGTEYANGIVLLPDNWRAPAGVTFKSGFAPIFGAQYYGDYQSFSLSEWQSMEAAGAVFLPAAGYRYGESVYHGQIRGEYWSSSYYNIYYAYSVLFTSAALSPQESNVSRFCGFSVRLVQDAE